MRVMVLTAATLDARAFDIDPQIDPERGDKAITLIQKINFLIPRRGIKDDGLFGSLVNRQRAGTQR